MGALLSRAAALRKKKKKETFQKNCFRFFFRGTSLGRKMGAQKEVKKGVMSARGKKAYCIYSAGSGALLTAFVALVGT